VSGIVPVKEQPYPTSYGWSDAATIKQNAISGYLVSITREGNELARWHQKQQVDHI
jgi:hypothetical protein